jgi:hypothetical protein
MNDYRRKFARRNIGRIGDRPHMRLAMNRISSTTSTITRIETSVTSRLPTRGG